LDGKRQNKAVGGERGKCRKKVWEKLEERTYMFTQTSPLPEASSRDNGLRLIERKEIQGVYILKKRMERRWWGVGYTSSHGSGEKDRLTRNKEGETWESASVYTGLRKKGRKCREDKNRVSP